MEADWAVELAADDPVILVPWAAPGDEGGKCKFVDLRLGGDLIDEIEEAKTVPALRSALLLLNGAESPLWTAKCDTWCGAESVDAYEMDAEPEDTTFGAGSYVDLLARDKALRTSFERQEAWVRAVTEILRRLPAKAARVDLVLRRAQVDEVPGYGVSWFVEGCGATSQRAEEAWREALRLALPVIIDAYLM